jgi:antitoxin YefM
MRTISSSQLRKNLSATLDQIAKDHEAVIVTRDGGKPPAVIVSLEDFGSYEETAHLLRSPANAKRLTESIRELETGGGIRRELADLA